MSESNRCANEQVSVLEVGNMTPMRNISNIVATWKCPVIFFIVAKEQTLMPETAGNSVLFYLCFKYMAEVVFWL